MLGFHVYFDQGQSNVENRTSKKILRSTFSVISVYDQVFTRFGKQKIFQPRHGPGKTRSKPRMLHREFFLNFKNTGISSPKPAFKNQESQNLITYHEPKIWCRAFELEPRLVPPLTQNKKAATDEQKKTFFRPFEFLIFARFSPCLFPQPCPYFDSVSLSPTEIRKDCHKRKIVLSRDKGKGCYGHVSWRGGSCRGYRGY